MIRRICLALCLLTTSARATQYWFDSAPFTTYAEFNPLPLNTASDLGHTVKQLNSSCSMRFTATTAAVVIGSRITYLSTRTYLLFQDGTQISSTTLQIDPPGDQWNEYTLASGLTGTHEYEILCSNPLQGGWASWYDGYLKVDTLNTTAHPNRKWRALYGDSRTGYTNSKLTDNSSPLIQDQTNATVLTDIWLSSQATSGAMVIAGVAGGKINPTGRDSTANVPAGVGEVHEWYGYNDEADMGTLGDAAYIALVAATNAMYDNLRTQIGSGKPIYSYAPFVAVGGDATKRNLVISAKQAALAGRANFYWVGTDGWITVSTAFMPDSVHQNVAGAAQLANRRTPIWSTTAITISGPSHGAVGSPSSAFTATLANGATFCGDQVVTLTVSGATLTATAAGGSVTGNGTGTVVVTPAAAQTAFTFTCTPASSGSKTLTPTSGQDQWTMPTPSTYLGDGGALTTTSLTATSITITP